MKLNPLPLPTLHGKPQGLALRKAPKNLCSITAQGNRTGLPLQRTYPG